MRSGPNSPNHLKVGADQGYLREVKSRSSLVLEARGNADRFLVARHLPDHISRLWRFAMVRCADGALADDLVQATCVRALERADQFVPGSRLDNWLFTILDSIWRNVRRGQDVRTGNGLIDVGEAGLASWDADEETRLQVVDTIRLIAALPEGHRSVLLLVCIEGLSYQEVAQTLAIPVGTVMSRLSSARSRMRAAFGD